MSEHLHQWPALASGRAEVPPEPEAVPASESLESLRANAIRDGYAAGQRQARAEVAAQLGAQVTLLRDSIVQLHDALEQRRLQLFERLDRSLRAWLGEVLQQEISRAPEFFSGLLAQVSAQLDAAPGVLSMVVGAEPSSAIAERLLALSQQLPELDLKLEPALPAGEIRLLGLPVVGTFDAAALVEAFYERAVAASPADDP